MRSPPIQSAFANATYFLGKFILRCAVNESVMIAIAQTGAGDVAWQSPIPESIRACQGYVPYFASLANFEISSGTKF